MKGSSSYQTLIIAGLGSIGGSMFAVGKDYLQWFPRLIAVDRVGRTPLLPENADVEVLVGDVTDASFLGKLLGSAPQPVLFLNLCAGFDNVRLRRMIAEKEVAYLDSACCTPEGTSECRFTRMMPYTLTPVESGFPHWLCWGINPGVVELVARMVMRQMGLTASQTEVTILEYDGLQTKSTDQGTAVSWCPPFLIGEMMISPSLVVDKGLLREGREPGGLPALVSWGEERVASRVVGHEDIWNLGQMLGVDGARFVYGLTPRMMSMLENRDESTLSAEWKVPPPETAVLGLERIAVQVRSPSSGKTVTLLWLTDHEEVWQKLGVNAVQFQTCLSLWFAIHMLQHTRFGSLPGTWCASNLPLSESDWREVESALHSLGMAWEEADPSSIRLLAAARFGEP
ncbi:MAG: hypothetical protein C4576_27070 [Desulfobacteraceae bacterium]|nr:MAG: hypothetical protein C4576_27070 [Desulfobacteraceae bacterium]